MELLVQIRVYLDYQFFFFTNRLNYFLNVNQSVPIIVGLSISIIDVYTIIIFQLMFICLIFLQNGIQLLIISELIWVFTCCLYFCYGFFFNSIFFGCCAFFILILAALDASIWIFILVTYNYFSNIENLFTKLPQIKFMLRSRRLLYNNYFFK